MSGCEQARDGSRGGIHLHPREQSLENFRNLTARRNTGNEQDARSITLLETCGTKFTMMCGCSAKTTCSLEPQKKTPRSARRRRRHRVGRKGSGSGTMYMQRIRKRSAIIKRRSSVSFPECCHRSGTREINERLDDETSVRRARSILEMRGGTHCCGYLNYCLFRSRIGEREGGQFHV